MPITVRDIRAYKQRGEKFTMLTAYDAPSARLLDEAGIPVRVVSMPSTTEFDRQSAEYRNSVLPERLPKVAVEAGVTDYWRKYVGPGGAVVGIDRYGESAPAADVFRHFGFTPENVAKAVRSVLT